METAESEGHTIDVGPKAPVDGTAELVPEIFPPDYWSVNKGVPTGTDDDLSESRWKQVSHLVQVWWNRIDDDEVAGIEGKASRLANLLQRKYGYTEYNAESQSIRWMRRHRNESEGK